MKAGDWVLVTKKTIFPKTLDKFLKACPLGVCKIRYIDSDEDVIIEAEEYEFAFRKGDLILLEEADENQTKKV